MPASSNRNVPSGGTGWGPPAPAIKWEKYASPTSEWHQAAKSTSSDIDFNSKNGSGTKSVSSSSKIGPGIKNDVGSQSGRGSQNDFNNKNDFGGSAFDNAAGGDDVQMACYACGETGHVRHECPNKPEDENDRRCFNCGDDGHNKSECPNPRIFTGVCNHCGKEGHMRKDCPEKPAATCSYCGQEGHLRSECQNPRKIDRSKVSDVSPEEAWAALRTAVQERDVDDVKDALSKYLKSFPDMTYTQLHQALRSNGINLWIIALERSLIHSFTNMDLQGNIGKKYTISYRFSSKPERPREAAGWPATEEEILARLADAGEVIDSGVQKCNNCDQLGHTKKNCPQEMQERERLVITCYNCNETGHRIRDCPVPRTDKFACKNCGQSGHRAAECTEPRSNDNVECRSCGQTGHMGRDCPTGGNRGCRNCGQEGHQARDCTEPKNMDNVQCRNCDEMGHFSKECPKPRDYSRVTCSNCGEKGHTKVRCKQPPKEPSDAGDDGHFSSGFDAPTGDDGFGAAPTNNGKSTWDTAPAGNKDTSDNWAHKSSW